MLDPTERLRKAIVSGNLNITKRLLARFPELLLNTDLAQKGWCNLHYALFHGHYLICFHLVSVMNRIRKHSRDETALFCTLDLVTFDNLTFLHMPLLHHHSQTLHFLLQEFSDTKWIDFRGGPYSRTPLHYCCSSHFVDGLNLLLEFGADWSLKDVNGDTCLHLCFAYGDLECIEALLTCIMRHALHLGRLPEEESDSGVLKQLMAASFNSETGSGDAPAYLLRSTLSAAIAKLENTPNVRGQVPVSFAALFEIEREYAMLKKKCIDKFVDDKTILKSEQQWDLSLSMSEFNPDKYSCVPLASPEATSLVNYAPIASVSRTSLDLDVLVDETSPSTEPFNSASVSRAPKDKFEKSDKSDPSDTNGDKDEHLAVDWKGCKHLRSLPISADLDFVLQVAETASRPSRQHAKSFAYNFRSSPLIVRQPAVPQNAQTSLLFPLSPLQVEFTSASSRKSSLMSLLARLAPKGDNEDPHMQVSVGMTLPYRANSGHAFDSPSNATAGTPSLGSFVHQFSFSPLGLARHRSRSNSSAAAAAGPDALGQEVSCKSSRTGLSRVPTTSVLQKQGSGNSLKWKISTPTMLANVFRSGNEPPAASLRHSCRTSMGDVPNKVSPLKLLTSQAEVSDGLPAAIHLYLLSRSSSLNDGEKKYMFSATKHHKSMHQANLPNLRINHMQDVRESVAEDVPSPLQSVRSISFASVREE